MKESTKVFWQTVERGFWTFIEVILAGLIVLFEGANGFNLTGNVVIDGGIIAAGLSILKTLSVKFFSNNGSTCIVENIDSKNATPIKYYRK